MTDKSAIYQSTNVVCEPSTDEKINNTATQSSGSATHKHKFNPIDDTGYEEITIAVVGNVDSGKSTLVGVLSKPGVLDNGKGLARSSIFIHPHEKISGRTSDISYQYFKDNDETVKKIYTMIDLAGHESYLRTTVSGLTSGYPDFTICCISDKITHITKEHLGLAVHLGIPVIIIFTKTDFIPPNVTRQLQKSMKHILKLSGIKLFRIDKLSEYEIVIKHKNMIPYINISNKTGDGVELLRELIRNTPRRERKFVKGFSIESVYSIPGYGTVVSGQVGQNIAKNDILYMGPLPNGNFSSVKIKTLHNDYHNFVDALTAGKRGCICIKISRNDKQHLRHGTILRHDIPKNICHTFQAKVKIFHHHTTIKTGYQAFINCGMVRGAVLFTAITLLDKHGIPINTIDINSIALRSGHSALIDMRFMNHLNYMELGQNIVFREGTTRGIGIITKIYDTSHETIVL
jgi:GTPase